jgi:uncharacterized membrane protein
MEKQTQENKQTSTEDDALDQWIPYAVAGVIFVLHLVAAMICKSLLMVFMGQLLALVVFLILRMAFPLPSGSQSAN